MIVAVKMATEVVGAVQSYGLPNGNAVYIYVGGEFEICAVIVRHAAVHHLGNVGQLLGVLNKIGAALRALSLRPNLGTAVPHRDVLRSRTPRQHHRRQSH